MRDEEIVSQAVRQALGDVEVEAPQVLAGGAMHQSWGAVAVENGEKRKVVIRISPAGRDDREKTRQEYSVLRVMHARGVMVPKPLFVGENELGQTFMAMDRLAGDSNPKQLLTAPQFEETRHVMAKQLAEQLAQIHQATPEEVEEAHLRGARGDEDAIIHEWDRLDEQYKDVAFNAFPAVVWGMRYVRREQAKLAPRRRPVHVVHGDFRVGNLMYDESGLTGILDWEGVHIGEPEDDLTWFLTRVWRFGNNSKEAGGLVTREEWVQLYETASGNKIDRDRLRLWEVLQNVRWANICMMQAKSHMDGSIPSHELAAIGRRTADTELEVLRLAAPRGATNAG
ncbi:hypothetical protein AYO38_00095 [bacterium SCGC AG-212-C10]|nr:hypothetical protein AYO38_00095 [bacterium SCGC AG-212-C10]